MPEDPRDRAAVATAPAAQDAVANARAHRAIGLLLVTTALLVFLGFPYVNNHRLEAGGLPMALAPPTESQRRQPGRSAG